MEHAGEISNEAVETLKAGITGLFVEENERAEREIRPLNRPLCELTIYRLKSSDVQFHIPLYSVNSCIIIRNNSTVAV